MSERQAGYAPQNGDEDGVRVTVQVQAPSEEIEDLVAVVVARLEGVGLEMVDRDVPGQETVELMLRAAPWVRER